MVGCDMESLEDFGLEGLIKRSIEAHNRHRGTEAVAVSL